MANESQTRVSRRTKKQKKKKPAVKRIFLILALMALTAFLVIGGLFTYYAVAAPDLEEEKLSDPASTKVYDQDGNLFAELGNQKRTKVDYEDLPQVLIDAVIATEDARFFNHMGIDPKRIGGAILANITDGFGAEGASTITQQVIKSSFLSPEKTLERKVQEQWLAIKLDSQYSKDRILEMYLNKIYYGNHSYGVAKAAENYFGKTDLQELTLPEAALLAGLPQRPSAYDPTKNPELAKERMETVLHLMVLHGKITEEQAAEAREVSIESMLSQTSSQDQNSYQAFLQQVSDEAKEKYGVDIYNDGVEIYTTLNSDAQEQVELLLSNSANNPISYPDAELQAGMTVLDTRTGAIQAIGGSRQNDKVKNGWNYAIDGDGRQPGSTFKPIIAYGPAIEYNQWSTYHQIEDAPYKKGDTPIRNWNRSHQGWVSMRSALEQSLNVPAVKTLEETGFSNAEKFAEGLGIDIAEEGLDLTDAIGGASTNVTSLELAGAYSAFGNEGIYNEPYSITKIEYSDGRTKERQADPVPAMREYTAYMITDMLKSVVQEGTGTVANIPGLPMAGKTGTTNLDGVEGSPDAWFSGYTTNYTISVWTGYDDSKRVIPSSGLNIAKNLFRYTMADISQGVDTPDFTQPDSVVEVPVERGSNPARLPSDYTPASNIVTELFVKGTEPQKTSERFDRIDSVSGLTASYNESAQSIEVSWNFGADESVYFLIRGGSGSLSEITTTSENSTEISGVSPGTYTVEVTAISETSSSNRSNPVTATVIIPDSEAEQPEEEPSEEEPLPEDDNSEENPPENQEGQEGNSTQEENEETNQNEEETQNDQADNNGNETEENNGNGPGQNSGNGSEENGNNNTEEENPPEEDAPVDGASTGNDGNEESESEGNNAEGN